jgi:hypothetical protein
MARSQDRASTACPWRCWFISPALKTSTDQTAAARRRAKPKRPATPLSIIHAAAGSGTGVTVIYDLQLLSVTPAPVPPGAGAPSP